MVALQFQMPVLHQDHLDSGDSDSGSHCWEARALSTESSPLSLPYVFWFCYALYSSTTRFSSLNFL